MIFGRMTRAANPKGANLDVHHHDNRNHQSGPRPCRRHDRRCRRSGSDRRRSKAALAELKADAPKILPDLTRAEKVERSKAARAAEKSKAKARAVLAKGKTKPAAKAKPEPKGKAKAAAGRRPATFPDTAAIRVLASANPKRPGSAAAKRFDLYAKCKTVADYIAAVGKKGEPARVARGDLAWDTKHGS
jgi:hypothetical protein